MKKLNLLSKIAAIGLLGTALVTLKPDSASAISISSSADCNGTPIINPQNNTRAFNGDCLIRQNTPKPGTTPRDTIAGNGKEEHTFWSLDFTKSSNLADFQNWFQQGRSLTSANLTLQLEINGPQPETDTIRIDTLSWIKLDDLTLNATQGTTQTFTTNLLNFYSSEQILSVFFSPTTVNGQTKMGDNKTKYPGIIPMTYQDDAKVSFVSLELNIDSKPDVKVPEPTAIIGLVLGGAGIMSLFKRRHK